MGDLFIPGWFFSEIYGVQSVLHDCSVKNTVFTPFTPSVFSAMLELIICMVVSSTQEDH